MGNQSLMNEFYAMFENDDSDNRSFDKQVNAVSAAARQY